MQYFKCFGLTTLILCWLCVADSHGKSIDRCDFVHELQRLRPQIDYQELNAWTCIAQYQSNFNTSLQNYDATGTSYHGIFQISNLYWCSTDFVEHACQIRCNQLHDTYLKDDVECVQKIYAEHLRIHGNGYSAWPIYQTHCSDGRDLIKDCLASPNRISTFDKPFQFKDKARSIAEKKVHKIYERCELARELYYVHNLPFDQIATWVCIAKYESNFNTSAIGNANYDGSMDHGLFQISDIYWCSPPGKGWVCGLSCAKLENSDIADDVTCMKKIYDEHQRLSGNGFNAWSVYKPRCKHNVEQFISGCFEKDESNEVSLPMHSPGIFAPSIVQKNASRKKAGEIVGNPRVFGRCELAQELRYKHNLPKDQIHTWVCIAQTLSSLNTAAEAPKNADGSSSHGLFQISDQYWCEVNGRGKGCNLNCNSLKDGDISDDIVCVQKIFEEHSRLFGNGFQAWAPYEHHCKYEQPQSLQDCFDNEISDRSELPPKPVPTQPSTAVAPTSGKIYERCELAKELRNVHNVPLDQIHTWVCIASHESRFDTSVIGRLNADGSLDHGLFQISDIYWCSNSGRGKGCNAACSDFRNPDISDDVRCVRQIWEEHQRLFGNGFHAWAVYEPHCRHVTNQFTSDCFPNEIFVSNAPQYTTAKPVSQEISNTVGDQGRGYEKCELAKELRYQHNLPFDQIADWVCIALYSSNLATSAKGPNSHGLFQISNEFWCSNNGSPGKQCNIECSKLEDADITDDLQCARNIYDTHQRLYSNGFSAWNVYEPYCKGKSSQIIDGCFDDISQTQQFSFAPPTPSPSFTMNVNYEENAIGFRDPVRNGKVYEKCELARELRYKYNVPLEQIHTWVCIVQRESNFDTSAIGRLNADGSLDHGLFQISDIFWCSNSGVGKGCNAACTDFENEDIGDDVRCVQKIFDEHQRLFGNGFHAWTTYEPYCKQTTSAHTDDCFVNVPQPQKVETVTNSFPTFVPFTTTTRPTPRLTPKPTPQPTPHPTPKPTPKPTRSPIPTFTQTTALISTPKPNAIAATLTPFNQFKFSTFAPFSFFTPTQSTTRYHSATAEFVNYYLTSTTKKPSPFITKLQPTETPITAPTNLVYFPTTYPTAPTTTPRSVAPIATKIVDNHAYAVIRDSWFTTTTSRPYDATAYKSNSVFSTATAAPVTSSTPKFNLFDLYLGRLTTKKPERYNIPTLAPLAHPVTHPSPYVVHTTHATPFNTYGVPDIYKIKTTTIKPSAQDVQILFQSQASSIAQSLGIQNFTFPQLNPIGTTSRPRVFRYSFSGTKSPTNIWR